MNPYNFYLVSTTTIRRRRSADDGTPRVHAALRRSFHRESNIFPIGEHLEMISTQFLTSPLRLLHPSHAVVLTPNGPRGKKETLYSNILLLISRTVSSIPLPVRSSSKSSILPSSRTQSLDKKLTCPSLSSLAVDTLSIRKQLLCAPE